MNLRFKKLSFLLLLCFLFSLTTSACVETPSQDPPLPYFPPAGDGDEDGDGEPGDGDNEPGDSDDGDTDSDGDSDGERQLGYDGDACTQDSDCLSDMCLSGPEWPEGHCTTVSCESRQDCESAGDENACLINPNGSNFCIRLCDPSAANSCREGYQCQAVGGNNGWCAPNTGGTDFNGEFPFSVHCHNSAANTVDLSYTINSSTSSYMVVPITSNGNWLDPRNVTTPSGTIVNFRGANYFQATGAQLFGVINPTVIPAAPQFQFQLESGAHNYRLNTADSEICYYLIESTGTPTTIDLNIYLVGLDSLNLSAANAASHTHLQSTLNRAETLLQQAGITLGQVRYHSVPADAESNYRVLRNQSEIGALLRYSDYPGDSVDSALSANIFIVERFAFGGGGVLGLSQGIPGAAGLHGTSISGVALTGEYMGHNFRGHGGTTFSGNHFTANVLVHELGHFLGLFHTSETSGSHFDPLDDTPQCTNMSQPWNCADWGNLMFPMADISNTAVTNDQSFVISVNPLTK